MFDFIEDPIVREQAEAAHKSSVEEIQTGLDEKIAASVTEATKGLKINHDKLLDEKKKLQETYKDITDPQEALDALKLINENEDMRMLKDGKFEEVIQKRVSVLQTDHEAQIMELSTNIKESKQVADKYKTLYENKSIEDTLREAAIGAKVLPHALKDALLQGKAVFSISEDGTVEARDEKGKLVKVEDKILTPTLWVEMNKKSSPHWWPPSEGGDLNPGEDYESIDAQMRRASAKGDTDLYRRLRDKKKKIGK